MSFACHFLHQKSRLGRFVELKVSEALAHPRSQSRRMGNVGFDKCLDSETWSFRDSSLERQPWTTRHAEFNTRTISVEQDLYCSSVDVW
jgi:hypothetical protein